MDSLIVDQRLDRLEAAMAELKEVLASVAGKLLAADAVSKPISTRRSAAKK